MKQQQQQQQHPGGGADPWPHGAPLGGAPPGLGSWKRRVSLLPFLRFSLRDYGFCMATLLVFCLGSLFYQLGGGPPRFLLDLRQYLAFILCLGFPGGSAGKASAYNVGDLGSIPGREDSPGEENGNPLQYSCLENPMDQEAWWATVHGVAKSWTRLSDFISLYKLCVHAQLLSCVQLFEMPWTVACQAPLSLEFSMQEYWSGLPFPTLADLPDQGIEPRLLHLLHWQADSLPLCHLRSPVVGR